MMRQYHGIYDTHAHYTDERFQSDRHRVLASMPERGVAWVLCCGSTLDDSENALRLAEAHSFVSVAVGVHPHECASFDQTRFRALLSHPAVVAVGEIGLDYHYDRAPREIQKSVFRQQLEIAAEHHLPVVLHDREAHSDLLSELLDLKSKRSDAQSLVSGVVHCYSGSLEMALELIAQGFYLGFGGAITFKNAKKALSIAAQIPLYALLLETDAPYMAPEPFRGTRCESPQIAQVAEVLALQRQMDPQELLDRCADNARRLFRL